MHDLANARNCREFLRLTLASAETGRRPRRQADFARRTGLSRSYLSEILSGKKGLSRDSLSRIRSGLKLPRPYLKLFDLLAERENPALVHAPSRDGNLMAKISEARQVALATEPVRKSTRSSSLVRARILFLVFAHLGSAEKGASLEEIVSRTQFPLLSVKKAIAVLTEAGVASEREARYYAASSQVDLLFPSTDSAITELSAQVANHIERNAGAILKNRENDLFFTAFSMRAEKRVEFKKALQSSVLDLIDKYQDDDGNCVNQVFLASFV